MPNQSTVISTICYKLRTNAEEETEHRGKCYQSQHLLARNKTFFFFPQTKDEHQIPALQQFQLHSLRVPGSCGRCSSLRTPARRKLAAGTTRVDIVPLVFRSRVRDAMCTWKVCGTRQVFMLFGIQRTSVQRRQSTIHELLSVLCFQFLPHYLPSPAPLATRAPICCLSAVSYWLQM